MNADNNVLVMFHDGAFELDVRISASENTVWLTLDQIASLFEKDKSTVSRHIKNIFSEGELDKEAVVANYATTASDGKTYQVDYYNLDLIISVGYRVKSKRGVAFRKWATSVLRLSSQGVCGEQAAIGSPGKDNRAADQDDCSSYRD